MKILFTALFLFFNTHIYAQNIKELQDYTLLKLEKNSYLDAEKSIQKAINLDPKNLKSRLICSRVFLAQGKAKEAEPQLAAALLLNDKYPETYGLLASLHISRNNLEKGIQMYEKAIEYEPSDSIKFNYYIAIASSKGMLGKVKEAIIDLEKAAKYDENNITLLNNLAAYYEKVGRIEESIKLQKRNIKLNPKELNPYINLAYIYSKIDSLELSEDYFSKALKINSKAPLVYSNRAYLYYKQKKYSKALKDINLSLELYPSNSYAYRTRALIYLATNNKEKACDDLNTAYKRGFKIRHGDEVEILFKKHCLKEKR